MHNSPRVRIMRTTPILLLALLGAAPNAPAAAGDTPSVLDRPYLAVRGGWSNMRDLSVDYHHDARERRDIGFDNGGIAAIAVGVQARDWLRLEAEISYRGHEVALVMPGSDPGGSVGIGTGLVGAYLEYPNASRFTPYAGIGLGAARISQDGIRADGTALSDDTAWAFAYQASIGTSVRLAPQWDTHLEYRFLGTSEPVFRDTDGYYYDGRVHTHALLIGVSRRLW